MPSTYRQRLLSLLKWLSLPFFLLFFFRLLYGYLASSTGAAYDNTADFFSNVDNLRKNYASEKIAANNMQQKADVATAQKYEKTATVKSKTSGFENDEAATRAAAHRFNGVIQYEQSLGNKGNREVHLLIGVTPALFDSFYTVIGQIGTIKATEITKVDKTNEYRKLNAKKASLEKTLASLQELKSKSGQISDYVTLHDKILEIETQLQELGVELGDFNTENEFCTIRFSLYEGAVERSIGLMPRLKIALEWTLKYYAFFIVSLFALSAAAFILLAIADKMNVIRGLLKKTE